jgi:hypothetical protein
MGWTGRAPTAQNALGMGAGESVINVAVLEEGMDIMNALLEKWRRGFQVLHDAG